jgi:heme-degrading monooxygenase HmoA
MVLERAIFTIKPGSESDFVTGFDAGRHFLEESEGCRTIRLLKGIESPNTFLLLIEWDELANHTEGFMNSPAFQGFGSHVAPYFENPPELQHYEPIDSTWDRSAT